MRRLVFALACLTLLLTVRLGATVSFVAAIAAGSTNTTSVTTAGLNLSGCTPNCAIVIASVMATGTGATPTDDSSNSYSCLTREDGSEVSANLCYTLNATVDSSVAFTSNPGSAVFPCIAVAAFSGVKTSGAFDQQTGNSASSSTVAPGSITPAEDNEVSVVAYSGVVWDISSIGESYTLPMNGAQSFVTAQNYACGISYKIQTSATATNPTLTFPDTDDLSVKMATFKQQPAASGAPRGRQMLFGVH